MHRVVCFLCLTAQAALGVDLYTTGFENFTPGPDRIAGAPATGTSPAIPATDGWTGTHAGQDRSGILAEASHAIPGVGNAAYIGGNTAAITTGNAAMYVRKTFNYQPVAGGNEVVTIRVLAGIKDSSGITRDDFDFLIYNNNNIGSLPVVAYPLAGIQFDNSQINPSTLRPFQAIYRYSYDNLTGSMRYTNTGVAFVYDSLQQLEIRINFRTNLWSASLDSVPLFSDIPFYTGPNTRNLGSLLVQCRASSTFAPGGNYLLFDDLGVDASPPPAVSAPDLSWTAGTGVKLRWWQEAGYRYEVQLTDHLESWQTAPGGDAAAATNTGYTGSLTDASAIGIPRRFYQIIRNPP